MQRDDDWLFPLLDDSGRQLLNTLREHPSAPRFTHQGCDRLSAEGLARVRAFEKELGTSAVGWLPGEVPPWLRQFVEGCYTDVPFYRRSGVAPADFSSIPTCERADLAREPWSFVPDPLPIDEMAVYQTSGTTGHPLNIITHPEPLSIYLPLIRAALSRHGVELRGRAGGVAIAQICFQKSTWTYISISPFLDQAAMVKINLNEADWREPDDRWRYLDACAAEIYTGDPISFAELVRLPLKTRPEALVSTSMALSPALKQELENHFGCPVVDIYSMNESGPIAVRGAGGFELLYHRLYVEVLHPDGSPCSPGERGEVVLSGGFNPFLPLLRYRTGDFANLVHRGRLPVLVELEGRPPVVFRGANGRVINNVDISISLKPFALSQFFLHQNADGSLRLGIRGAVAGGADVGKAIIQLFGDQQALSIENISDDPARGDKVVQYSTEYRDPSDNTETASFHE